MKQNYLKKGSIFLAIVFLATLNSVKAQSIKITMANAQITTDGVDDFYEADILLQETSGNPFKLGDGQMYFNYNTAAFGTQVSNNGNLTYQHAVNGGGYLLDEYYLNTIPVYGNFIQNDNTNSRVSIAFLHVFGTSSIVANNVTNTPKLLLHIKIKYLDSSQPANICFETAPVYLDLFYTACGDNGAFNPKDCFNQPGLQIFNDTFDCSNSVPTVLSIGEVAINKSIQLYPNPTSNAFAIKGLQEKANVSIVSLSGKIVLEKQNYQGNQIDISHLASGVYFVKTTTKNGIATKKLIKE